ncbi:MAG: alpha/beta fold hydrolase, partial [Cyanobium sp.]
MPEASEVNLPASGSGVATAVAPAHGSTPLLVAVHGWLLSGMLWEPLERQLQGRFELWRPDLPGFVAAERPRGLQPSLASYGRWLAEAVRRRAGARPVVLVGHSLGGSVALHAAPLLAKQLRGV